MEHIHAIPLAGFREPFSSLSHVVGASIFAALTLSLLRRGRGDRMRLISLAVMAYASIQTLMLSSVYHMLWPGPLRDFMLRADVAAIFVLIAGCLTPVQMILFEGNARWASITLVWTLAFVGMITRLIFFEQLCGVPGVVIFLVYGWAAAITATILWRRFGWNFIRYGVLAGISYTVGATALLLQGPVLVTGVIGPHELWHIAVLSGLGLHWRFVFQFAAGQVPDAIYRGKPPVLEAIPVLSGTTSAMPWSSTITIESTFREVNHVN